VEYERQPGASGEEPNEPATGESAGDLATSGQMPATETADQISESDEQTGDATRQTGDATPQAGDATPSTESSSDLDTDADVVDDAFESAPRPPEWPAADLVPSDDASVVGETAATAAPASDEIAATYAAATAEPDDLGDDSDAPIQMDDALPQHVRGDNVNLSQGGVQSIDASTVTLSQGGAGQVRADSMSVEMGGVGLARVSTLTLGNGASAFAVVADTATVEEGSNAFLVVTRSLSGNVRPTIDWRGALALGAGMGLVMSILRRLR
jgi:hypothetical protein